MGFCAALIEDALRLQSRVTWHSALLGRKQSLRRVLALLRERGISRVATTTIDLGRTTRWAVAFSVAAGPAPRGDARVFAKKRDPARDVAVPADCSVPELRERLSTRAVALNADATVSDVDADGALWRVRVVSRGARLDAVLRPARAARTGSAPCRRAPPTRSPASATACRATSRGRIGGGGGSWLSDLLCIMFRVSHETREKHLAARKTGGFSTDNASGAAAPRARIADSHVLRRRAACDAPSPPY